MDLTLPGFQKWPKAAPFADIVEREALAQGVPPGLMMGMIAQESGFNPKAYRFEAAVNDASRGLMQILYGTARGIGYRGTADGLFDPATNVHFGVLFFADGVRAKSGDLLAAISRYNDGRGKRVTEPTRFCLRKDANKQCVEWFNAQPGQFLNQPYVDAVVKKAALFGWTPGATGGVALLLLAVAFL